MELIAIGDFPRFPLQIAPIETPEAISRERAQWTFLQIVQKSISRVSDRGTHMERFWKKRWKKLCWKARLKWDGFAYNDR